MRLNLKALFTFYGHVLPSSGHTKNYYNNILISLPGFTYPEGWKLVITGLSSLNIFVNNKEK